MVKRTKADIARIIVNVIFFLIVFVLGCAIEKLPIEPYRRGFFCNDNALKYPYLEDTVSVEVTISLGVIVGIVTVTIVEWVRFDYRDEDESTRSYCWRYLWIVSIEMGICIFGCSMCQLGVGIIKLSMGRLRPHFLAVCNPDYNTFNCSDGYIADFVCRPEPKYVPFVMKQSRMSFPSGHCSYLAYCMVYIILYLNNKVERRQCGLVKYTLQFTAIMAAAYVTVSRVDDYKHHDADVWVGFVIGAFFAIFTRFMIATHWTTPKLFRTGTTEELPQQYKSLS